MSNNHDDMVLHRGLVDYLAGKLVGKGCSREQLVETGLVGLSEALDNYPPGVRFSAFATPIILAHMRRHLSEQPELGTA